LLEATARILASEGFDEASTKPPLPPKESDSAHPAISVACGSSLTASEVAMSVSRSSEGGGKAGELGVPTVTDRSTFQAQLDELRVREKAHTREGDAIAAARRRLPMVAVDGAIQLTSRRGAVTLLDAFEGRRMLIAYYFMWYTGKPAPEQCEGCTWFTTQVRELSNIHSRDVTYATFCQGPYAESARYHDFMGWEMPWYSAQGSLDTLLAGRKVNSMYLVCYLRVGSSVFETYWTTVRGVEAMDNSYRLLDLSVYGRQEMWEDSPSGWPQCSEGKQNMRRDGRPIAQWNRLRVPCLFKKLGRRSQDDAAHVTARRMTILRRDVARYEGHMIQVE
jgi:predicted dithiol-disulfide oxidoreductase (DUF899 family)